MSVNGIGQNYYQNNISTNKYNRSKAGQFYQQKQAAETSASEGTRQNANVQDIYEALKSRVSNGSVKAQDSLEDVTETDAGADDKKLTVWYKGKTLDEWALTSPKYTDSATGISWYVIDGKQPYMTGEDAEKFKKLCEETGEFPLKKFAEMTGTIQHLDDNTTAYIGDNGTAIKSKDGKELWINTSSLSYDALMNMFKNLPKSGNYFDNSYWQENIQKAMAGAEPLNHFSNERVLPDKELEQADRQESETKTEIITKPDGSRVLVMTMSIGGMETTMSLEISKPTEVPNENSKQDTDNNMPSADAEMDTVSDEMSNISTEA